MAKRSRRPRSPQKKTVDALSLLQLIPDDMWEKWEEKSQVDHQVSRLKGRLMFCLLLYTILNSKKQSTRILADYYNSELFSLLTGKGGHQTRHSSIASRLSTMQVSFFQGIFENYYSQLNSRYKRYLKQKANLQLFDSTMVRLGAGLTQLGMRVGPQPKDGKGNVFFKFTVGLDGVLPRHVKVFFDQPYLSDETPLKDIIQSASVDEQQIVLFDGGLKSRRTFIAFDQSGLGFITRMRADTRYEILDERPVQGQRTQTLELEKDLNVHLYYSGRHLAEHPFRLIIGRNIETDEQLLFLTNIMDLSAQHLTDIYLRRWDIEVFFRFIKQEIGLKTLVSYNENGIKIMLYMRLIAAMLILVYRLANKIEGFRRAKVQFLLELQMLITKDLVRISGGNPELLQSFNLELFSYFKEHDENNT